MTKSHKKIINMPGVVALFLVLFPSYPAHSASDLALKAGFVPHKALYEMHLSSKKSSAGISNISGKMFYEWHTSPDGWVSNHKFDMLYEYTEIPATRTTSEFSSYESFDGTRYNFNVRRKRLGDVFEELRGAAARETRDEAGDVIHTLPEELQMDLPAGVLFPMAHSLDVLEKLKSGKHIYKTTLFDGSDTDGPVEVNTVIGKEVTYHLPEGVDTANIDMALVDTKAWNIRLAFFPYDQSDTISDYEMSLIFHENGVISSINIDYEDFSITQNLIAIESIDEKNKE